MRILSISALTFVLACSSTACKKDENYKDVAEADQAETQALLESATDTETMADEVLEVAAELSTTTTDPVVTEPELAQALSQIDSSFMQNLNQNEIIETVFAKLDTNQDSQLSSLEVQTALGEMATKIGTMDPQKLSRIVNFMFNGSQNKHKLREMSPRIEALMNNKRFHDLRTRKRVVAHKNLACRMNRASRSSYGLVGKRSSGACVKKPYGEVNSYMMPFPRYGSFHEAIRQSASNPDLQKYFSSLQESMHSLKKKMDDLCQANDALETKDERISKMCNLRAMHVRAPHFGGVDYLGVKEADTASVQPIQTDNVPVNPWSTVSSN